MHGSPSVCRWWEPAVSRFLGNDDVISFIDECFFTYFCHDTWWIDSGATVYITNSSQRFLGTHTTRGERSLKVVDRPKAKVEVVRSLPLSLHGNFTLIFE
jgi:hypothetical protein